MILKCLAFGKEIATYSKFTLDMLVCRRVLSQTKKENYCVSMTTTSTQ